MSSDHGPRLRALILAAEALTAACEEDMAGPNTEQFTDDEPVGISDSPTGDTAVTFGMIRRTRAALDALLRASPYRPPKHEETKTLTRSDTRGDSLVSGPPQPLSGDK